MAAFEQRVKALLDRARETLGAIEMEVRENGEVPALMEASRQYARFCMHAREYLSGIHMGRPFPRRFAQHLAEVRAGLADHRDALEKFGLGPTPQELEDLAREAEALPGVA